MYVAIVLVSFLCTIAFWGLGLMPWFMPVITTMQFSEFQMSFIGFAVVLLVSAVGWAGCFMRYSFKRWLGYCGYLFGLLYFVIGVSLVTVYVMASGNAQLHLLPPLLTAPASFVVMLGGTGWFFVLMSYVGNDKWSGATPAK